MVDTSRSFYGFLKLPVELRLAIYRQVVLSSLGDGCITTIKGLFFSCKTIHSELKDLVHKTRVFWLAIRTRAQFDQEERRLRFLLNQDFLSGSSKRRECTIIFPRDSALAVVSRDETLPYMEFLRPILRLPWSTLSFTQSWTHTSIIHRGLLQLNLLFYKGIYALLVENLEKDEDNQSRHVIPRLVFDVNIGPVDIDPDFLEDVDHLVYENYVRPTLTTQDGSNGHYNAPEIQNIWLCDDAEFHSHGWARICRLIIDFRQDLDEPDLGMFRLHPLKTGLRRFGERDNRLANHELEWLCEYDRLEYEKYLNQYKNE